jgi:hypothetical protein
VFAAECHDKTLSDLTAATISYLATTVTDLTCIVFEPQTVPMVLPLEARAQGQDERSVLVFCQAIDNMIARQNARIIPFVSFHVDEGEGS